MRYSALRVIKEALTGHKGWTPAWRDVAPQAHYDYIVIGGGGHGLATAYYLARNHGAKKVAVLEKGWIGGGNVGRNTTIIRSNYLLDGNEPFYEHSLKLWEGLEQDLNYNAMVSQRGILNLIHSDAQRDAFTRRGNAMILNGADADLLSTQTIQKRYPFLNVDNARFPIKGGLAQHRGGTVRHDAVAWGYARAADQLGVDIIQNCEVTGFRIQGGTCLGVETSRGYIAGGKIAACVAGSSGRLMSKAGMRLPIESHVLQAFVSEGLKPVLPGVITFGRDIFIAANRIKAAWSLVEISTAIIPTPSAETCPLLKMSARGQWLYFPCLAVCAFCACGAVLWICRWMALQSSTAPILTGSISTVAGAMAASKPHRPLAGAMLICWPGIPRMNLPKPIALTGSKRDR
jgi:sarcosine oxidase subunit beta